MLNKYIIPYKGKQFSYNLNSWQSHNTVDFFLVYMYAFSCTTL